MQARGCQKAKKASTEFKKQLEKRIKARKSYCKKHPKNYKGKKRGRKPAPLNERFYPEVLPNGDTHIELLTHSRYLLMKSRDKWSNSQRRRGELLFELYPKIEQTYNLIHSLRCIFRNKSLDRNNAKVKLHEWSQKVSTCTLREIKSARDTIKTREDEVLNYFISRSTNASAESLNAKIKKFR